MRKRRKGGTIAIILVLLAVLAAGGYFVWQRFGPKPAEEEGGSVAYVDTVASLMGLSLSGTGNRYSGVVESQETWSARKNDEYTVEEILVSVGDTVEVGTPLFKYEIGQFESALTQSNIDMERLQNELVAMQNTKAQLEKDAAKAPAAEKANYTIQLQEAELSVKQKDIDIQSKQLEIDKLKENIEHATVTSELAGVVKSINNGTNADMTQNSDAFITIMQVGDFRIKGTINEQNMYEISEGLPMLVHSRVREDEVWRGTVARIDTENAQAQQSGYYSSDGGNQSSNYPFYVTLEDSTGLILGQHVYMEMDDGSEDEKDSALRLMELFIVTEGEGAPFVWMDQDGKLVRQSVTLGAYDEEAMEYEILDGITAESRIAFPDPSLSEGMATADMADMAYEEGGEEFVEGEEFGEGELLPEEGIDYEMMPEGLVEEGLEEGGVG